MVIVMNPQAGEANINAIVEVIQSKNAIAHVFTGEDKIVIGVIGETALLRDMSLEMFEGVEKVLLIKETYKLANKSFKPGKTVIDVNGVKIGGTNIVMMAGPCSVESEKQIMDTAIAIKKVGAQFLRGGAFKPRTSPYGFQGLGEDALKMMLAAKQETGLNIITEVTNEDVVDVAYKYVDMFQIGARNVQNFNLLRAVGRTDKPVLLKRGMSTTIEEWLNSAEYIMNEGNHNVVLCERGIRTFETSTRNTLDISAVPVLRRLTHLPVIIDPSHAGGKAAYVGDLARAGVAAGADGLIVEVHPNPVVALSDAAQQITPKDFETLCISIKRIAEAIDKTFEG